MFPLSAIADVESFWWLCVWCVLYFCVNDNRHPTETQLHILTRLFPVPHHNRHHILERFINVVGLPELELQALSVLNEWRKVLRRLYQQPEGTRDTVDDDVTKGVVKDIRSFVDELYQSISDAPVEIVPSLMR